MPRRLDAATILLVLVAAPVSAQVPAHWRDELASPTHPLTLPMFDPDTVRWPASPLSPPPRPVRALYVNAWAFGGQRLAQLIDLAEGTEVNSLRHRREGRYRLPHLPVRRPYRREIGANTELRARDIREGFTAARARNHPIARIVVRKTPPCDPEAELVIRIPGGLWHDRLDSPGGCLSRLVWVYAAQLAEEAVRWGSRSCSRLCPFSRRATSAAGHRRLLARQRRESDPTRRGRGLRSCISDPCARRALHY